MRILALDTTTRAGSVAVVDDGRVLIERGGDPARSHAERFPAELLEALAAIGSSTAEVDLYAVASGPGSFTGLRIGIATIQGLAFVHQKRVVPVLVLLALAATAARGRSAGTRVAAWLDARRHDVFSALYEVAQGDDDVPALCEREGPMVGSAASALERWGAEGLPAAICGDGAVLYASLLPDNVATVAHPPLAGMIGRLAAVAAAAGSTVAPAGVQPLYVRRPDAEVLRDSAHAKP